MSIPSPDIKLLALCSKFLELEHQIANCDAGKLKLTDERVHRLSLEWNDLLEPIQALHPATDRGLRAKAQVALGVMRTADEIESPARNAFVRSALADILNQAGGAA